MSDRVCDSQLGWAAVILASLAVQLRLQIGLQDFGQQELDLLAGELPEKKEAR